MKVPVVILCACFLQVCLAAASRPRSFFLNAKHPDRKIVNIKGDVGRDQLFIVKGKQASAGQFPYQIALDVIKDSKSNFCGAVLITPSYALTAAHCVYKCDKVTIALGILDLTNFVDPPNQIFVEVNKDNILVHPNYSPDTVYNDIAIIKLGAPVKLSRTVGVVKLPSLPLIISGPGKNFITSGWGKTSDESDPVNAELMYLTVPYLSYQTCKQWYLDNAEYVLGSGQWCTDVYLGQSTCRGDSGGPVTLKNSDGSFTLVGLVSLGVDTCEADAPNVHTDVYSYLPFIKANTDYVG